MLPPRPISIWTPGATSIVRISTSWKSCATAGVAAPSVVRARLIAAARGSMRYLIFAPWLGFFARPTYRWHGTLRNRGHRRLRVVASTVRGWPAGSVPHGRRVRLRVKMSVR